MIDTRTPWRSGNELGGVSFNLDKEIASGTLTVTTAWRYWVWDPSNDRDYLELLVGTLSQAPSKHEQLTQEVRWAGEFSDKLERGLRLLRVRPEAQDQSGAQRASRSDYFRFIWNPSPAPNGSPNIALWGPNGSVVGNYFNGQRSEITSQLDTTSAALFSQLDWAFTDRLHLLPGLRYNYDDKKVEFNQQVFGVPVLPPGSPTPPAAAYTAQTAIRDEDDTNVSGQLTLAFAANDSVNYYATYATAFKSIGVNLGGGAAIQIPPEDVKHIELGIKSNPDSQLDGERDHLQHGRRRLPDSGSRGGQPASRDRERRRDSRARRRVRRLGAHW